MTTIEVRGRPPSSRTLSDAVAVALPENYRVIGTREPGTDHEIVIVQGEDRAGWTAADYVIPRLASGLYVATIVDLDGYHESCRATGGG